MENTTEDRAATPATQPPRPDAPADALDPTGQIPVASPPAPAPTEPATGAGPAVTPAQQVTEAVPAAQPQPEPTAQPLPGGSTAPTTAIPTSPPAWGAGAAAAPPWQPSSAAGGVPPAAGPYGGYGYSTQSAAAPAGPAWAPPGQPARRLTRSQEDRVLGGVLGGLARYWNTDPLLLRILTVVLTIATGGALAVGYLIAWLAIPLEPATIGTAAGTGYAAGGNPGYGMSGYPTAASGDPGYGGPGYPDLPGTNAPPAGPRPPRSYLGWLVLSAALVLIGVLALIGLLADPTAGFVALTCSAVLILLGAGMMAGAWFGRARWLAVVAIPMVFVTMGAVATHEWVSSPAAAEWLTSTDGGITVGSRAWTVTPADLADQPLDYQVTVGDAVLDLTALTGSGTHDPVAISARVALGALVVIIPEDMRLELNASVRAGQVALPGSLPGQSFPERSGTDLDVQTVIDPETVPPAYTVTLDATIGAGSLEVLHEAA